LPEEIRVFRDVSRAILPHPTEEDDDEPLVAPMDFRVKHKFELHQTRVFEALFKASQVLYTSAGATFRSEQEESVFVTETIKQRRELELALAQGLLQSVENITLSAHETMCLLLVYTPATWGNAKILGPDMAQSGLSSGSELHATPSSESAHFESGVNAVSERSDSVDVLSQSESDTIASSVVVAAPGAALTSTPIPTIMDRGKGLKSIDAELRIRLANISDAPLRVVRLTAKLAHASLSLQQHNIHLGHLVNLDRRSHSIVINNTSAVPVLYSISKSETMKSSDLEIPREKMGVLAPHASRQITFVFTPSFAGEFMEKLTVQNVQNPRNKEVLTIKADISRPEKFWIGDWSPTKIWDFGQVVCGFASNSQTIEIKNITNKTREYQLTREPDGRDSSGLISTSLRFQLENVQMPTAEDLEPKSLASTRMSVSDISEQLDEVRRTFRLRSLVQ
jgi:hypothetical protein